MVPPQTAWENGTRPQDIEPHHLQKAEAQSWGPEVIHISVHENQKRDQRQGVALAESNSNRENALSLEEDRIYLFESLSKNALPITENVNPSLNTIFIQAPNTPYNRPNM